MKANLYKLLKTSADISPMAQYAAMIQYSADNNAVVFDGSNIAANTIYGGHIQAGSIVTEHIKAGSIVSDSISAAGILANKIVGGSLYSTVPLANGGSFLNLDNGNLNIGNGSIVWDTPTKTLTINASQLTLGNSKVLNENSNLPDLINKSEDVTRIGGNKLHFTSDVTMDNTYIDLLYANQAFIQKLTAQEIDANRIKTGTLDANIVNVINLDADNITAGTLSADFIKGGTIDASGINVTNLKADNITTGILDTSKFIVKNLSASVIQTGTLDANKVTVANLSANAIKAGTLDASVVNITNLSANSITSGTIDARDVKIKYLDASEITTGTLDIGGNVTISAGGSPVMTIDSDTRELTLNISRLTINTSPVATKEDLDKIELTPGEQGVSIVDEYYFYLASAKETGITLESEGWTRASQKITIDKPFLWSYRRTIYSNGKIENSIPIISGSRGDDGEDGEDAYRVEIRSTNGSTFKNGIIDTWLYAVVYKGKEDITSQVDANRFRWERVSADATADATWNERYFGGAKEIKITHLDVYNRATFNCTLLDN